MNNFGTSGKNYKECFPLPFENIDLLLEITKKNRPVFPFR